MLRKIDCVLIRVDDVSEALHFYSDVFGLKPIWEDERAGQAGLLFPESDSEVVLHTDPNIPGQVEVHYLVDDVERALQKYTAQGCSILAGPFHARMGKGAVIQDPFGVRLCLLDRSRSALEKELI